MRAAVFALEGALARPMPGWRRLLRPAGEAPAAWRRHAATLVALHARCGHTTVLLTGAPERTALEARRQLRADLVLALPRSADAVWERPMRLTQFLEAYGLTTEGSYAYGGRYEDRLWLELFTHPVAANPGFRLRRHALAAGWRRIDLDSATPAPPPASPCNLPVTSA